MANLSIDLGKQAFSFGVTNAFGAPQEVDGVTFVPVALAFTGFGGGEDGEQAGGGGGGGLAIPVGAYVRQGEGLRFEPNIISLLAVTTPLVVATGLALSRVVRAFRK